MKTSCHLEKLIEYLASAVILVSSNPCVGPSTRTKIYFFLLSICTEKLLLTPKTFLSQSKPRNKKGEQESNPIP